MNRNNYIRKAFLFAIAVSSVLFSSCQSDTDPACLVVEKIGYEPCGGALLVSVKSPDEIGNSITYDGNTYSNVIKVFTLETIPESTAGFIRIRDFDVEKDENFLRICPAIYAPIPAPLKVATFWSEDPC
jgi:hypothetical protein